MCILFFYFFSGECYFRQWLPVSSRRTSSRKTHRGCVQRRPGTKGNRTITFSFTVFFFLPCIRRRRRRCLNSLLLWSRNFATMVTWRHTSPLYKHWYRLITVEPRLRSLKRGLVISRFSVHTLYCNWGWKYRSLYRGLRSKEFRYIQVPLPHPSPQVLTFVPIRSFPSLWISLNPHPLSMVLN